VIPIFDMGAHDDLLFIAMRYVVGADLRAVLKAQRVLTPDQTLLLIGQAGRALDAAHRNGLVHRDVKPGNILIERGSDDESEPDHVYLSDFGLSKHAASRSGLTATGEFMGTVDYISPEQIRGRPVDGRADIYSLGCVLYECLTGRVPFSKDINAAVIWAHVEEMPTAPSSVQPTLPPSIDHALAKALAKDPADRYATCRELVAAVRAALRHRPVQPIRCRRARQPFTRRACRLCRLCRCCPTRPRRHLRRCRRSQSGDHPRLTPGLFPAWAAQYDGRGPIRPVIRWSAARWSAARWSAARWPVARWPVACWPATCWSAARWPACDSPAAPAADPGRPDRTGGGHRRRRRRLADRAQQQPPH
jgi:serine/threonine protein kinase